MRLELTGRHVDITDGVRRIVDSKLAKLERRLNDTAVSAQVVLTHEKTGRRADITLHARGEKFMHGTGQGGNVSAAMSEAVDKLTQQAQKLKGQWQEKTRRAGKSRIDVVDAPEPGPEPVAKAPRVAKARRPRVLNGSRQKITVMSISDASTLVDGGMPAIVFRDAETGQIAVVYRAPGGDLALIHAKE
ncbi:MAG: ribosome-associated translation inhibitor RaiA [Vicinamibacterales bacterium]